jgi:hypothetical protein
MVVEVFLEACFEGGVEFHGGCWGSGFKYCLGGENSELPLESTLHPGMIIRNERQVVSFLNGVFFW